MMLTIVFFTRYSLYSRDGVARESWATPPPALMLFQVTLRNKYLNYINISLFFSLMGLSVYLGKSRQDIGHN